MLARYFLCKIVYTDPQTENTVMTFGAVKKEEIWSYLTSPNNFISIYQKFEKSGHTPKGSLDVIIARSKDDLVLNKGDIEHITLCKPYHMLNASCKKARALHSDLLSTEI